MFLETLSSHFGIEEVSEFVKYASEKFYSDKSLFAVVERDHISPKEIKNAHRVPKLYNTFPNHFFDVKGMIKKLYHESPEELLGASERIMSRVITYRSSEGKMVRDFTLWTYDISYIMEMLNHVSSNGNSKSFLINAWSEPPNNHERNPEAIESETLRDELWKEYVDFLRESLNRFQQKD